VAVFRDPGGVADLERLAWWVAPDPVEELTVVGNRLLVQSGHRLDVLTYSDDTAVGVPALAAAGTVRAAPNPFNPRTTLRFAMPAAGRANVTVHDARGRRVRTLTAQLPAGPARVRWDGTAGDGRVLPSGTYLVRVVTPGGVQTGRCQLVR
jgi:flagellar hook assembly protein FlgD